jgi:integrase
VGLLGEGDCLGGQLSQRRDLPRLPLAARPSLTRGPTVRSVPSETRSGRPRKARSSVTSEVENLKELAAEPAFLGPHATAFVSQTVWSAGLFVSIQPPCRRFAIHRPARLIALFFIRCLTPGRLYGADPSIRFHDLRHTAATLLLAHAWTFERSRRRSDTRRSVSR